LAGEVADRTRRAARWQALNFEPLKEKQIN